LARFYPVGFLDHFPDILSFVFRHFSWYWTVIAILLALERANQQSLDKLWSVYYYIFDSLLFVGILFHNTDNK